MMTLALAISGLALAPALGADYGPLPEGATVIAEGYKFPEGPAVGKDGWLYFTDVRGNALLRWKDGAVETVAEDTGAANGVAFNPEGVLYTCQGGAQSIGILKGNAIESAVSEADGKSLNAVNDIVFAQGGTMYVTNPGTTGESPKGVVQVRTDGTSATVATDQFYPNGIGLSPDGKTLYVNDTMGGAVTWKYAVGEDGAIGAGEKFVEWGKGAPDGMAIAASGNVYIALNISAQIAVVAPDGKVLREFDFPKGSGVTNACFGGDDRNTLYVTLGNHGKVVAMPVDEPGLVLPGSR